MSAHVRIVLVEPREAGNIGAAARAMKNFGFDDLVIVADRAPTESNALWWSSGAEDLLERSRTVPSLGAALSDVHLAVATTSSRGRTLETVLAPPDVAAARGAMGNAQTIAVVFGREDHGLTAAEAAMCHSIAVIPTDERFPTMNLAQSVSIFCYELSRATRSASVPFTTPHPDAPSHDLQERLHERAAALLLETGFLHEENPDRVYGEMRDLVARLTLTARETQLLLTMVRQIEWKLQALAAGE